MATKAALGVIEFGDTPVVVGELRAWRQASDANEIDTTVMGTPNSRFQPGSVRNGVECDLFFEPSDAGQALILTQLANDTPQAVALYPNGKGTGLPVWNAVAYVMQANTEGAAEGAIEMTTVFSADETGGAWTTQA